MASQVSLGARTPRSFFDTNILVYTDDPRDPAKQVRAVELVKDHLRQRTGVLSLQVLQEYFTSATERLKLAADLARRRVEFFAHFYVVEPTVRDVLAAVDLNLLRGFSYWDALILHSAKQSGCSVLLTEDLQHGQVIDGVRVINPFI